MGVAIILGSVFAIMVVSFAWGYKLGKDDQKEEDDEKIYSIIEETVLRAIDKKNQIVIDKVCNILIDMLNEGMIETRDIGKVNMRIRKALEE